MKPIIPSKCKASHCNEFTFTFTCTNNSKQKMEIINSNMFLRKKINQNLAKGKDKPPTPTGDVTVKR